MVIASVLLVCQRLRSIGSPGGAWALQVGAWVLVASLASIVAAGAQTSIPPAKAAAPATVGDLELEQLLALEVQSVFGASKFLQKTTEAPSSVTIVSADDIRRYGYRTLADILGRSRGMHTSNDRTYSFIGVRGFLRPGDYNTRVLVLVDGFRVNDNVYDQAPIGEEFLVPLEMIERVEIIRGPGSSLYGSNAFFAVVNVITKQAAHVGVAEVTLEAGTLGAQRASVQAGHVFGNGTEVVTAASLSDADGHDELFFPELDAPDTNNGIASHLDWERRRSVFGTLRSGGLFAQAAVVERTKGVPTGSYGAVFNDPAARVVDRYGALNVSYRRALRGAEWQTRLFLGGMGYVGDLAYADEDDAVERNRDEASGWFWGVESLATGTWRTRHTLTAGVEVRDNFEQHMLNTDVATGTRYLDERRASSTWAWFGQDHVRLGRHHIVSVGLRQDYYDGFEAPVMPRLAWIVVPREGTSLKVVYGSAFRAPNAYEVWYAYGPYKANSALGPERTRTAEAMVETQIGRRIRVSAGAFRYWVNDLITQEADPADDLLVYRNAGDATASGVELETEGRWAHGFTARASLVLQRLEDRQTRGRPANAPERLATVAIKFPIVRDRVLAGLDVQAVGRRLTTSGADVAAYAVPNLTLQMAPRAASRMTFAASVYNLFDHRYRDPAADELPQDAIEQNGRTVRLSCSWRF